MSKNLNELTTRPTPPRTTDLCEFCRRRCRVPLSRYMPDKVQDAYVATGWTSLATCEAGALMERRLLGASYLDVIADRVGRVAAAVCAEAAEHRRMARQVRLNTARSVARSDQALAEARELMRNAQALRGAQSTKSTAASL